MVSVTSLWIPVLLSAVLVFVASSLVHMVFTYHRADYGKLAAEDDVMAALRPFRIPPGDYLVPCGGGPKDAADPAFQEKMKAGPVILMTVMPNGGTGLGASLVQWFLYCIVVGVFAAYVGGLALAPGADYRTVFRVTSTVAFTGYVLALWQNSIWFKRSWATTARSTVDGLGYALLVGGTFGWLWP